MFIMNDTCLASRVRPDLWSCCHPVDVRIGWVLKLLQDVGVLCLCSNLLCFRHSTLHGLQRRYWHEGVSGLLCINLVSCRRPSKAAATLSEVSSCTFRTATWGTAEGHESPNSMARPGSAHLGWVRQVELCAKGL